MEAHAVGLSCSLRSCNSRYFFLFKQPNHRHASSSNNFSHGAAARFTSHMTSIIKPSTLPGNKFALTCVAIKKRHVAFRKNEARLPVEASVDDTKVEFVYFHSGDERKRDEEAKNVCEKISSDISSATISTQLYQTRRHLFRIAVLAALAMHSSPAFAVKQSLLAGRIPGLSSPDENGLRIYRRPDEKSGGHGVGWSPIIPYSFKVPEDWEEVPVSIADLGGTEIDLRFTSLQEGNLSVVVAPVLRFSDGLDDNAKIEDIGTPDKVINAFGPEITGESVEDKVKDTEVKNYNGRTYYQYVLEPHRLISVTAAGNRLYIMSVSASGRQWKKHASDLKLIRDSFQVG